MACVLQALGAQGISGCLARGAEGQIFRYGRGGFSPRHASATLVVSGLWDRGTGGTIPALMTGLQVWRTRDQIRIIWSPSIGFDADQVPDALRHEVGFRHLKRSSQAAQCFNVDVRRMAFRQSR